MLPSNLNLNIEKIAGCNNRILINNAEMKIGSNRNVNKAGVFHQKSIQSRSLLKCIQSGA